MEKGPEVNTGSPLNISLNWSRTLSESSHWEGQGHWWIATYLQSDHGAQSLLWVFTWDPHPHLSPCLAIPCSCPSSSILWLLVPPPVIPWGASSQSWPLTIQHSNGLCDYTQKVSSCCSPGEAWDARIKHKQDGGEVNSRIFQMRQAVLNLPRLSCHAAKIHMTFNMREIKTNNKSQDAEDTQIASGTLRANLEWVRKER